MGEKSYLASPNPEISGFKQPLQLIIAFTQKKLPPQISKKWQV